MIVQVGVGWKGRDLVESDGIVGREIGESGDNVGGGIGGGRGGPGVPDGRGEEGDDFAECDGDGFASLKKGLGVKGERGGESGFVVEGVKQSEGMGTNALVEVETCWGEGIGGKGVEVGVEPNLGLLALPWEGTRGVLVVFGGETAVGVGVGDVHHHGGGVAAHHKVALVSGRKTRSVGWWWEGKWEESWRLGLGLGGFQLEVLKSLSEVVESLLE